MSMYLSSGADQELNVHLSYGYWASILQLAHEFGWEPARTLLYDWCNCEDGESPELIESWEGDNEYFSSDHQIVTADDARAIAEALEAAVKALPDKLIPSGVFAYALDALKAVVALCRAGEFRLG